MTAPLRIASGALLVFTVLLQLSVVQQIHIGGASPDLVVLVIVSIALLSNSVVGAAHGFIGGLAIGLFAALPLGPHAMLGTVVGYFAGRWGEVLITDEHPVPPVLAGAAATAFFQFGRPVIDFIVNPASATTSGIWMTALIVTLINTLLAIPVFVVVRSILRSVSVLDLGSSTASARASVGAGARGIE